jgi:SAM-dependent methyltransferase
MTEGKSHSSLADLGAMQKLRDNLAFFRMKLTRPVDEAGFNAMFESLDELASTCERLTGRALTESRVLKIGFGSRPAELIAMMSMGIDVTGIDLDLPMVRFSIPRFFRIMRRNGAERAVKTAVRNLFFDRADYAVLRKGLERRGHRVRIEPRRFLLGDACTYDYGDSKFDVIYSQNVFEHIPPADLETLVARLGSLLAPGGIAVVTPTIYTGIIGAHLTEWYPFEVDSDIPKVSEPWEHLRKNRYTANAYLNRLSRADYRRLFTKYAEIVEETPLDWNLGRKWLTPEVREELKDWSEDELFSNETRFVLRAK